MATARSRLVDSDQALFYHLVSRCVRQSWLCGRDKTRRRDYSHRKRWITERLEQLAGVFPVEVYAYAIMSNHFHLVVYYDPKAKDEWSDREVAQRWYSACPPRGLDGLVDQDLKSLLIEQLLEQPERLEAIRRRLGSLSTFMQLLKQPIARRANLEDGCRGHFFEQRFYSGALLSEAAVVAAMAYVDLNPIRAKIAETIDSCKFTSIERRLSASECQELLAEAMTPLISGLENQARLSITFAAYLKHLQNLVASERVEAHPSDLWHRWVRALKRQQRVYGSVEQITIWLSQRRMQHREVALP